MTPDAILSSVLKEPHSRVPFFPLADHARTPHGVTPAIRLAL
jgi:hypothetical protein